MSKMKVRHDKIRLQPNHFLQVFYRFIKIPTSYQNKRQTYVRIYIAWTKLQRLTKLRLCLPGTPKLLEDTSVVHSHPI